MSNYINSIVFSDELIDALKVACSALDVSKRYKLDMIEDIGKTYSCVNNELILMYRDEIDHINKANRLLWDVILSSV